ncbi:VTT domain-containing protein [Endozoicomonas sp. 8E]|uniref:VTT domain-containing protein n=1 Tax=Endozoicomonas sp. 8E TaxID=3035692 RepID=UPI0029391B02|nr:VTT domain-containing protein [Endozoicomonas sp. 8E]WOG26893.1 VTT domain-containing protein [Endozoicomonas sp. 8E]
MESDSFVAVHEWLHHHGYWLGPIIALAAFVESLVAIGFLIPGVALLFALGVLAGSGLMEPLPMLAWAFVGAALGDGISFQVGHHLHGRIRNCWPFSTHPGWLEKGERFFERYGGLSVALGRFIGPIRPVIPAVAGMMDMSPLRFYIINLLSTAPWAVAYTMPGYLTGAALKLDVPQSFYYLLVGLTLVSLLIAYLGLILDRRFCRKKLILLLPVSFVVMAHISLLLLTVMDVSGQFDDHNARMHSFIASISVPIVEYISGLVTWLGSALILWMPLVLCAVYFLWCRRYKKLLIMSACLAGMEATLWLMKWGIDKPRPADFDGLDQFSFPSGHTTQATFVWLLVTLYLVAAKRGIVKFSAYSCAMMIALMVALSRLVLEAHWFGDVLAGLLLGSIWFSAAVAAERVYFNEKILKPRIS